MGDLADQLAACQRAWDLRACERLAGGFRSEVRACETRQGDEVILKLTATPREARAEAAALAAWSGTGAAVRLIEADLDHGALLLDRIRPGTPLPGRADQTAVPVATDLLSRLHQVSPGTFAFPALGEVYERMEDQSRADARYEQQARNDPERGVAGLRRLGTARAAALDLCASTDQPVLLHGDFLDKNLLRADHGYLAIDPIPSLGDPCADAGFFAAGHPPAAAILERAGAIAARMGLNQQRARRWAAVWTVLDACSAWRVDQPDLEALLLSDEFERALAGAGGSQSTWM